MALYLNQESLIYDYTFFLLSTGNINKFSHIQDNQKSKGEHLIKVWELKS